MRSSNGDYNYHFRWCNEEGFYVGFNDVWAPNKKVAVKLARAMETKAHWAAWDGMKYITVPNEIVNGEHCFRMKGMYVVTSSMKRATHKHSKLMTRIGNMLTY